MARRVKQSPDGRRQAARIWETGSLPKNLIEMPPISAYVHHQEMNDFINGQIYNAIKDCIGNLVTLVRENEKGDIRLFVNEYGLSVVFKKKDIGERSGIPEWCL